MSGISKPRAIEWEEKPNGCWECTSHRAQPNNYPQVTRDGKVQTSSHFVYEECFEEVPKGMVVCHKCDNPLCINPEHLYMGTYSQNLWDRVRTNSFPNGENAGAHKLTSKDVTDIRREYKRGMGRKLGRKYEVDSSTITRIANNRRWRGVPNPA